MFDGRHGPQPPWGNVSPRLGCGWAPGFQFTIRGQQDVGGFQVPVGNLNQVIQWLEKTMPNIMDYVLLVNYISGHFRYLNWRCTI